jgi:hypothetical protein
LKKIEHNYTAKIKASARKARGIPASDGKSSPMRRSVITDIMVGQEQKRFGI